MTWQTEARHFQVLRGELPSLSAQHRSLTQRGVWRPGRECADFLPIHFVEYPASELYLEFRKRRLDPGQDGIAAGRGEALASAKPTAGSYSYKFSTGGRGGAWSVTFWTSARRRSRVRRRVAGPAATDCPSSQRGYGTKVSSGSASGCRDLRDQHLAERRWRS